MNRSLSLGKSRGQFSKFPLTIAHGQRNARAVLGPVEKTLMTP